MASPENTIVREWLRTLDLSHHLDNFIDNGYDDLETCKQIGEEDMDAIGVQDLRQREDLRQAVARLKQEGGTAVYFTLMGPESDYIYEEDVAVDYGYAEDEDEKVHSMLNGGSSGMCDCRNCECIQEEHFEVQPQCYLDRHRWKWTEHHLRRGSFEGATEYRRMMSEHPTEEVLVSKARSASAVERGGFIEAVGGMSPHEQKKRMFRSLKETGRNQHSGSSLTSTCSESSSGPTSPEHAMSASNEEGVASGESSETRKGRSRSLRSLFKKLITSPGEPVKAEGTSHKQGQGVEAGWRAAGSNLSNADILKTWELIKLQNLTQDEAWEKALEIEEETKRKKASSLSPTMTQLAPSGNFQANPHSLKNHSAEVSPVTPSDTDSARGTEGPTGSDGSPQSLNKCFDPSESCHDVISSSDLQEDRSSTIRGLTFENSHAKMASPSDEPLELSKAGSLDSELSREEGGGVSGGISTTRDDMGDYLEPSQRIKIEQVNKKRNRSKSSPADPKGCKTIKERLTGLTRSVPKQPHSSTSSPDDPVNDRLSEASNGSLDRTGTISSCTSSSSKSSGDVESKRPSYEVEALFFDSNGDYIGPYQDIAIVNQDVSSNPHDVDMLPLMVGDVVYVTKKQGGYWEGISGKRRGKFKFIHVNVMTAEELEKEKLQQESDDADSDVTMSEIMQKYDNLKELLKVIQCEQYYSILHLHDFGLLEQFKYLEEDHLDTLNITDRTHIARLTTAARMLRDTKTGKGKIASQQLQKFLLTRTPRGRTVVRDSGFYASTETCVSFDSSGLHRSSEAGDSLTEECETGYQDDDGVTSSSDDTHQENSNVNNSNCVNAARKQNGTGKTGNAPCRHGVTKSNFGNGQPSGSPSCPRKEGNGSSSPLAHHVCRVHTNGTGKACTQQQQQQMQQQQQTTACNSSCKSPTPYRDSPLFKHRHLMATFSDPGSAPNSPRLQPSRKLSRRCPVQAGQSLDHQCPSPDVVPKVSSDDVARWRKSALIEMYGVQDPSRLRGSGTFVQSSLSKTHPSPKLPRRVLQQYHCQALQSNHLHPPVTNQQKGRRKSRSMSPHHHKHHVHHHHQQRERLPSQNSVHGTPTLPLRPSKSPRQQASAQLEWHVDRTLQQEAIDLKEEPYSNKMGFCGIPPALVQRYAEELEAEVGEVAVCLESIRVRELVDACRCWFRSDALAGQSSKLVYAGTGKSVEDWLTSLGLPMYIQAFTLNGWDELDIVIHMDKEDLRKCGIDRAGHLRRLSTALEHLKMSWKPL